MVDAIKLGALDSIIRYKLLIDEEKQIFARIVLNAINQKMTEKLYISRSSVEKHRALVMKKILPCLLRCYQC